MESKEKNSEKAVAKKFPEHVLALRHYYFSTEEIANKELVVITGGFERNMPEFGFLKRKIPYYVIECVTKGQLNIEIDGKTYLLNAGSICGIAPWKICSYKGAGNSLIEHYYIVFTGTKAAELLKRSTLAEKGVITVPVISESINLVETIYRRGIEEEQYSQEICCSYLKVLLLELSVRLPDVNKNILPSMETYRACKSYIDGNFSNIISVVDISNACNINVKYMARLFKKYSGLSPSEYIMRLKLNKASVLLVTTDMSVKQIAFSVGFADPYHFSRNFKNAYGNSPKSYKKKHLQLIADDRSFYYKSLT